MRCPHAVWAPLSRTQTQPKMTRHDIVCLHTMAGYFQITEEMFRANGYGGTESHFGVRGDGFGRQWQDTDFTADANYQGNHRIISIETADHGNEFPIWSGSNVPAWTPAQIDTIVAIVRWACDTYDIPKELVPDSKPGRRGIAYHRQGIDPWRVTGGEKWSMSGGKVCPGDRRIHQLTTIVIPRVQDDNDMTEAELRNELRKGESRQLIKDIAQGAILDGLRPRTDAHPERGVLRGAFADVFQEVLAEELAFLRDDG